MLMPKRVKRRRVFRGRMKGAAHRGNFIAYGEYGLVALEPCWVTATPSVAARYGSRFSPTSPSPPSLPKPAWAPVKVLPNTGWPW